MLTLAMIDEIERMRALANEMDVASRWCKTRLDGELLDRACEIALNVYCSYLLEAAGCGLLDAARRGLRAARLEAALDTLTNDRLPDGAIVPLPVAMFAEDALRSAAGGHDAK